MLALAQLCACAGVLQIMKSVVLLLLRAARRRRAKRAKRPPTECQDSVPATGHRPTQTINDTFDSNASLVVRSVPWFLLPDTDHHSSDKS